MDEEKNRTVIVTGGGTGIGRGIARRLLRDGFLCVLAGPDESFLVETVQNSGVDAERALVVMTDLRDPDEREELVQRAVEWRGRLFGLVNNAGVTRLTPLLDESVEEWRNTITTNLEACFFLAQLTVGHMRKHGEGRIVNIGSIHGLVGRDPLGLDVLETSPGDRGPIRESAYAASKGGLLQITRDLATAVGRWGITVNAVSPGFVSHPEEEKRRRLAAGEQSGLVGKSDPRMIEAREQISERIQARVPLRRLGRVEDVAGPVSFLMSCDASYLTGTNIVADGGFSAW
ncbi:MULTISPECIES: SDR family NAD(P)-dependent oxidoreductase [Amycolatopsis]|uniref:Gluconate 5-dehydrogenase/3-oxoacyl-[acyl-carrier protein] reductase/2-deoxy-D-gluconate 3-dehydrogenase n=2 Tax=Amycolatopsis TaxID=1813 RepID=A0A1I3PBZ7_9PSEU|nr:SDR family NAD(P)-dependent oxidoreductase [Amycolatopsis sacchari]SFJ19013.1 gluconate 5-dehydrogenase/3-oxoacyl-[acyl-carrier protein] reductase/2-deoxy-D-gluconate 3-dehydrogenase [Amycolatopsis sacchari]